MYALWCDVTDVRRDSCVVSCHVIWIDLNVCLVMSCDHLVAWIVRCRSITCDVPYTTRTYTTLTYTTLTYTCTTQVACDVQHIRVVLTSVTCHVSVALDPYKTHDHLRVIVVQYRVWCVTPHDTKHTHRTRHTTHDTVPLWLLQKTPHICITSSCVVYESSDCYKTSYTLLLPHSFKGYTGLLQWTLRALPMAVDRGLF